jgi:hypothetical protein
MADESACAHKPRNGVMDAARGIVWGLLAGLAFWCLLVLGCQLARSGA